MSAKTECSFCGVDAAMLVRLGRRLSVRVCVDCGTAYEKGLRDGLGADKASELLPFLRELGRVVVELRLRDTEEWLCGSRAGVDPERFCQRDRGHRGRCEAGPLTWKKPA